MLDLHSWRQFGFDKKDIRILLWGELEEQAIREVKKATAKRQQNDKKI
jgi:hypothetical protein